MKPRHAPLRLADNSRVAVVGGGPAGSLFAIHALDFARQVGLDLDLTIFERKDFSAPGPAGCNMCAGILSAHFLKGLNQSGITLPPDVIMGRIGSYVLHLGSATAKIRQPSSDREIVTVYRGGGPRAGNPPRPSSFDAFLLAQATDRGARLLSEYVAEVDFRQQPVVTTSSRSERYDLVVMATGVNHRPFSHPGLRYTPPKTEIMAQDEIPLPVTIAESRLDSTVHVYFDQLPHMVFAGLIPKGRFVNVSLLGHHLPKGSVARFLAGPEVKVVVNHVPEALCGCRPHVAVSPAKGYYADRFVAVGDACVTRLYKDGIGSAFITARCAAKTAVEHGISARSFATHYSHTCRAIAHDNLWGRALFWLWGQTRRREMLVQAWLRVLNAERALLPDQWLYNRALWGMFTGENPYRDILLTLTSPRAVLGLSRALAQELRHR